MKDLHSLLPCSAAVAAACVSSVAGEAGGFVRLLWDTGGMQVYCPTRCSWYGLCLGTRFYGDPQERLLTSFLSLSSSNATHVGEMSTITCFSLPPPSHTYMCWAPPPPPPHCTEEVEGVTLRHFSHALALWYVAAEEACNHANQKGKILPGTLRQSLIDALHYLDEPHVRTKAHLKAHTAGKAAESCHEN